MTEGQETDPLDLLLIEDNSGDVRILQEAFKEVRTDHTLHVVTNGEEALQFIHRRGEYEAAPRPDLILLDLNLPIVPGIEVLKEIKGDPELTSIPVIILTGSEAEQDVFESYRNHSNACLIKPVDPDDFISLILSIEDFWMRKVQLPSDPEFPGA